MRPHQRTVECYDCHQQVHSLKEHRKTCIARAPKKKGTKRAASDPEATTVFMLLDVSGSMAGAPLEAAKAATTQVFDEMDSNDRFAVCTFDTGAFFKLKPRPVEELRRKNELPGLLGRIYARGGTALYDALAMTLEQIHDKGARNHVMVITDGEDNASKHCTLEEALALLDEHPAISLTILHVDANGEPSPAYERLAENRGTYRVIRETEAIVRVTVELFTRVYRTK